ncbi:ribosomal protein S6 kinase beta-2-like [Lepeophtheirus salmonis]|uniref:ribosomal protein S6 kinase beta-2-like n=1 Tax=Lepeophtheirus salmonis TaxID=72036 RepID=UPI001AE4B09E|nr:serine/threonine-protein kinase Aurora-2-like [Lepeophtheirus salmonis]
MSKLRPLYMGSKYRKEAFARSICCTGPINDCGCEVSTGPLKPSIKDFNVIDCLGKGGFGSVYLVSKLNETKDNLFALKVVDKNKIKDNSKDIEHALTEMEIMINLEHPFIVKVYDVFESSRRMCYLMEFLQGGELYTWLERKNVFEEPVACYYLAQIFLALIYLHEEGILYRDLKPENIMFDFRGNIKLVDFGLSQNHMKLRETRTMCGTTSYMPPEVILREWYSYAADWWSFGILAYDMMIGVPPFMGNNREETRNAIMENHILFPSEPKISLNAKKLIKSLVIRNPKDRISGWNISHLSFFDTINFKEIYNQNTVPPLVPDITSPLDVSNFPPESICPKSSENNVSENVVDTTEDTDSSESNIFDEFPEILSKTCTNHEIPSSPKIRMNPNNHRINRLP